MVGKVYGCLTVEAFTGKRVVARCACGSAREYDGRDMRRGRIISCGCKPQALTARHPKAFRAWWGAIQRCHNPNYKAYATYGLAGVRVADEWKDSFGAFFAAVGDTPTDKHSLDRFPDPFGNYEPGNVRWATAEQQARNQRRNHEIWKSGLSAKQVRRMRMRKAELKYRAKKKAEKMRL